MSGLPAVRVVSGAFAEGVTTVEPGLRGRRQVDPGRTGYRADHPRRGGGGEAALKASTEVGVGERQN